jgi:CheY-like chemotaxis protein
VKENKIFFIADDDADDRELFIEALRTIDAFCECITATDGEEALSKLNDGLPQLPDFIFLDLNMPRMNGRECLTAIKKNARINQIPVIIYSTSAEKKDIEETIQSGAAYFLQKPNRFDDLSKALGNIISRDWSDRNLSNS